MMNDDYLLEVARRALDGDDEEWAELSAPQKRRARELMDSYEWDGDEDEG